MNRSDTGNVGADGKTPSLDAILSQHTAGFAAVADDDDGEAVSEGDETAQADTAAATETGAETQSDQATEEAEETAATGESDAATEATESAGIDEALRALDETNPALGNAVRSLQTAFTKSREQIRAQERERAENDAAFKAKMAEVDQILADYRAAEETADTTAQETAEADALEEAMDAEGLTADQKAMYRRLLRVAIDQAVASKRLVSADALAQGEKARAQQSYVATEHAAAAKAFGEEFGKVNDDGTLVLDTALKAPAGPHAKLLSDTRNRLSAADRGMTWADVWKVARYDDAVKEAYAKGVAEGQAKAGQTTRVQQRKNAATVNASAPPGTAPSSLKPTKGESRDAFYERLIRFHQKHAV